MICLHTLQHKIFIFKLICNIFVVTRFPDYKKNININLKKIARRSRKLQYLVSMYLTFTLALLVLSTKDRLTVTDGVSINRARQIITHLKNYSNELA